MEKSVLGHCRWKTITNQNSLNAAPIQSHIIRITAIFGCQQVNFLIFPNFIRQPAAIVKTKIEGFIKNLDWVTSDIANNGNWNNRK